MPPLPPSTLQSTPVTRGGAGCSVPSSPPAPPAAARRGHRDRRCAGSGRPGGGVTVPEQGGKWGMVGQCLSGCGEIHPLSIRHQHKTEVNNWQGRSHRQSLLRGLAAVNSTTTNRPELPPALLLHAVTNRSMFFILTPGRAPLRRHRPRRHAPHSVSCCYMLLLLHIACSLPPGRRPPRRRLPRRRAPRPTARR